jgi:hypothetical protein
LTSIIFLASPAFGSEPLLSHLRGLKDVSIPLGADSTAPTVRLRFGEIKSEPIRLGPFSFGLLPRRVIEGAEIRLTGAQGQWIRDLRKFLQKEPVMAAVTMRSFRMVDTKGETLATASEATIAQSPWRVLLWDAEIPKEARAQRIPVVNLHLEGPEEGHLISADKSWKVSGLVEPRTDHEEK